MNLYAYAGNNPVAFSDPMGLCPWCERKAQQLANWGARRGGVAGAVALNAGAALAAGLEASGVNDLIRGGQALSEGRVASGLFLIGTSLPGGGKAGKVAGGFGDIAGGVAKVDEALAGALKWLGDGYKEIAPGVYRSADDARQFRMTTSDLTHKKQGTHVHFGAVGPDGSEIVENSHVRIE